MRNLGHWVAAATLLTSALACGGRQLNDLGDLNSDEGGSGNAGAPEGGTSQGGMQQTGGAGGSMPATGGSGAQSGAGGVGGSSGSCASGNGCLFQEGNDVRALAADETTLYWVEYGTHDELGNFNNDGRLLSRAFDSDEVRTLAEGLEGPIRLDLTTNHAYVYVDRYWDGGIVRALLRVPMDGGDREFVAYGVELDDGSRLQRCMHCLVHSGERVYWPEIDGIWSATETNAEGQNFVSLSFPSQYTYDLAVSGDQLLFVVRPDMAFQPLELYSVPLDGGTSQLFSADAMLPFTVSGDYIYGVDWPLRDNRIPGYYISRSKAAGGPWTRLVEYEGFPGERLEVVGDLVFHDRLVGPSLLDATRVEILQGTLDDPQSGGALLGFDDGRANDEPYDWIGTPSGIYWTSGDGIYLRHNAY